MCVRGTCVRVCFRSMKQCLPLSVEFEGMQDGGPPLTQIPQMQRVICTGCNQGALWDKKINKESDELCVLFAFHYREKNDLNQVKIFFLIPDVRLSCFFFLIPKGNIICREPSVADFDFLFTKTDNAFRKHTNKHITI